MFRRSLCLACLLGAALACPAYAAQTTPIPEDAIVAGKWGEALKMLAQAKASDPVALLVAGHAFLATDRTNEAMCAFAAGALPEAREAWRAWTSRFELDHPSSAMAHYLSGDAFARDGDWAEAKAEFDRALTIAPSDPLILNARAVAAAGSGDWGSARDDLLSAESVGGAPRDVRANEAVFAILHRDDADAAGRIFSEIAKRDPNNLVAMIGRGAVAAVDRHWDEARKLFRQAASIKSCVPLAVDNLLLIREAEAEEKLTIAEAQLARATPGTQTYKTFDPKEFEATMQDQFALVHASTFDAAKAVGALDRYGALSSDSLGNPNVAIKGFANALNITGHSIADIGTTAGNLAIGVGVTVKSPLTPRLIVGGVAAIVVGRTIEASLTDMAASLSTPHDWTFSKTPTRQADSPGGLWSAPPKQAWDNGNWPVVIWPALLYAVAPPSSAPHAERP